MSIKGDLMLLGAAGAGLYLVIANADKIGSWLGSQVGKGVIEPATEAVKDIYDTTEQSGKDTGLWLKQFFEGNLDNVSLPANAPPTEETIEMLKKAGQYYDPVTNGFIPFGYQSDPIDPTHKPLVKTADIYAAVQQKFIAAGAISPLLGNAVGLSPSPPASPSLIDSLSALYAYQGKTYEVVTSNLGTQAIQIDNMTIPIENLSNIATPEQKAEYVPQGELNPRFSSLSDTQIRMIPGIPFGFNRLEHYSEAAWTEINSTLANYLGV
jgi:hypothetical protein